LLLSKDPNALILETLKKVSQKIDNPKLNEIWEKAFVLCKTTTIKPSDNVQEFRASKHWFFSIILFSSHNKLSGTIMLFAILSNIFMHSILVVFL
jgi:hypothetical protein